MSSLNNDLYQTHLIKLMRSLETMLVTHNATRPHTKRLRLSDDDYRRLLQLSTDLKKHYTHAFTE